MRTEQPNYLPGFAGLVAGVGGWTPDGRAVLLAKFAPGGQREMWLAPLDGEPRKLDLELDVNRQIGQLRVHPDGRQVAFDERGPRKRPQIWVLENFLPNLKAGK